MEKIPLVSVIIPMYNSAKFIPQTLESLLYQTMQDFEVVVVDDCSTDNSVAVVESFIPQFDSIGVKLHVIKLPKNTGTPGLPRNVGIQLARGKYIAFLDSDDLFTKTALKELTTLAEKSQADVLKMGANFILWNGQAKEVSYQDFINMTELIDPKNFKTEVHRKEQLSMPTFESENLAERIQRWIKLNPFWAPWLSFYRRDFLIGNQILFSDLEEFEDAPFTFETLCFAKKYLNVPNITYIVRPRINSASRDTKNAAYFSKRVRSLIKSFRQFERIMARLSFFKERPDYRYAVLKWIIDIRFQCTLDFYMSISPVVLSEFVKREFNSENASLNACLFNTINIQRLQIARLQQELNGFRNK